MKTKTFENYKGDMRIFNQGALLPKKLTERVTIMVTPKMLKAITKLIEEGNFPSRSELIRHLITRYLDNKRSWL